MASAFGLRRSAYAREPAGQRAGALSGSGRAPRSPRRPRSCPGRRTARWRGRRRRAAPRAAVLPGPAADGHQRAGRVRGSPPPGSASAARRRDSAARSARAPPPAPSSSAKLSGPSKGQKSVQVKERSWLGRAIIMSRRAARCAARWAPSGSRRRPRAGSSAPCSRGRGRPARGRSRPPAAAAAHGGKAPSAPMMMPGRSSLRARRRPRGRAPAPRGRRRSALAEAHGTPCALRRVEQQVQSGARDGVDRLACRRP